jgi:hypothetical protein
VRKIKLNLDELKVESFVTTPPGEGGRGTVEAHTEANPTCIYNCTQQSYCTCSPGYGLTCHTDCGSCEPYTCVHSCNDFTNCGTCYDPTCGAGCTSPSDPPECESDPNYTCATPCYPSSQGGAC